MNNPFCDPHIDQLRQQQQAVLDLPSGRRVFLPASVGFCQGVRHAVQLLADTLADANHQRIWLLGAMIHNPAVNQWFVKQGLTLLPDNDLDSLFTRARPSDVFVIPAFGLTINLDERLRTFVQAPGRIVDTTCPFVRRVWQAVSQAAAAGDAILIHGKPGHQETMGICSRAARTAPAVAIIPTPDAARRLLASLHVGAQHDDYPRESLINPERLVACNWTLVNQTTMLCTETEEIAGILAKAPGHHGQFTMANTLCPATRTRQAEVDTLCAKHCEVVVVLGGTDSSNTTQLYRLASKQTTTYFLQSPEDLSATSIRHYLPEEHRWNTTNNWLPPPPANIGVLVGASCPDSEIAALLHKLHACA